VGWLYGRDELSTGPYGSVGKVCTVGIVWPGKMLEKWSQTLMHGILPVVSPMDLLQRLYGSSRYLNSHIQMLLMPIAQLSCSR